MKIDNRNAEHRYPLVSPVAPTRPVIIEGDLDDNGPIMRRDGALVPTFAKSNLPVLLTNTEEQRRARALEMANVDLDVRSVSPRDMAALGLELYVAGHLSWDDYAELSFQPQLHPSYDATIGALEGKQAEPDAPQDFVRVWEERLSFDIRYNGDDALRVRQSERIVGVMRQLAGSTYVEV